MRILHRVCCTPDPHMWTSIPDRGKSFCKNARCWQHKIFNFSHARPLHIAVIRYPLERRRAKTQGVVFQESQRVPWRWREPGHGPIRKTDECGSGPRLDDSSAALMRGGVLGPPGVPLIGRLSTDHREAAFRVDLAPARSRAPRARGRTPRPCRALAAVTIATRRSAIFPSSAAFSPVQGLYS